MLANPDIAPSASINRWIVAILTFHFTLVHVAGSHHGPDGLSRRPRQPDDDLDDRDEGEFDDWIDKLHGFVHQINDPHARTPVMPYVSTFTVTRAATEPLDLPDDTINSSMETAQQHLDYDSIP
jgi:hypothetical protein